MLLRDAGGSFIE